MADGLSPIGDMASGWGMIAAVRLDGDSGVHSCLSDDSSCPIEIGLVTSFGYGLTSLDVYCATMDHAVYCYECS